LHQRVLQPYQRLHGVSSVHWLASLQYLSQCQKCGSIHFIL
jgi:hypothetical protein